MVRLIIALICVLVLQFPKASCQETNWILYSGHGQSNYGYFDGRNILRGMNTVVVWQKFILNKKSMDEEQKRFADPGFKFYDMTKSRVIIDFKNNKYKLLGLYEFLDDKMVSSFNCENISKWDDIVPDGLMEEQLLALKKYLHIEN